LSVSPFVRIVVYGEAVTSALSIAANAISAGALAASASALFAWRQLELAKRQRERDFEATVVAELVRVERRSASLCYEICVTNAGPAVARDVDVSIVEWIQDRPLGRSLCAIDVAPALLRGEQRIVSLELNSADLRFDDRHVSTELHAAYYDDNGVRNDRLAFVVEDALALTPPQ
jgi:hypothetical protein